MIYEAHINVMPLKELLDPQGKAIVFSLHCLQLNAIQDVRVGKHIILLIEAATKEEAHEIANRACKKLLHNEVMEDYTIIISE